MFFNIIFCENISHQSSKYQIMCAFYHKVLTLAVTVLEADHVEPSAVNGEREAVRGYNAVA